MYDRELTLEILSQIQHLTGTILRRFEPIRSPEDFTSGEAGFEKMDPLQKTIEQIIKDIS